MPRNVCRRANHHRIFNTNNRRHNHRSTLGRVTSHIRRNYHHYQRAYRTAKGAYSGYKVAGLYGGIAGALREQF